MSSCLNQLLKEVDLALAMTIERLSRSPTYGVYIHAREQLESIRSTLVADGGLTVAKIPLVDIGIMAVKELEASDPEYADKLCLVDYLYKKLSWQLW
jgi:hypothetical protein